MVKPVPATDSAYFHDLFTLCPARSHPACSVRLQCFKPATASPRTRAPAGCLWDDRISRRGAAVIGRYDAVLKADWESGNVAERVYTQIQKELEPVRSACAAGRDGEARAMVAANKSRHGYPNQ